LVDLHRQPSSVRGDEGAVDPNAAASGEIDDQHADQLPGGRSVQRVPGTGGGVHAQGSGADCAEPQPDRDLDHQPK
jgi:hypothetical protein